ncbi:MAG TPA: acyl-CoA dehydrogenase family protein [Actinomycetales bacterium]|jgi:glutaryl-CoA dehydrogenase|nr:acyl-CoA dehydrogenase family protein [Actinomycetales bacterium]
MVDVQPPPFDTADPLLVDRMLGRDEKAVRETVRRFCEDSIQPRLAEWLRQRRIDGPHDLAKEMGALGVLGMDLDGHAGGGLGAVDAGVACMELESCDAAIRSFAVHTFLPMFAIARFGDDEQQRQWLPALAAGEVIGSLAGNEPGGLETDRLTTSAVRDGSDWVLNGRKTAIIHGAHADISVVWATTGERVQAFLVPVDAPGFRSWSSKRTATLRDSLRGEIELTDVRVPADAVLPRSEDATARLATLLELRYATIWGALGAARASFDHALAYSRAAAAGSQSGGDEQAPLVDMALELSKGLLLAVHLGQLKAAGLIRPTDLRLGKISNATAAIQVCETAKRLLPRESDGYEVVVRHLGNLRSMRTSEYATQLDVLAMADALTGREAP